MSEPTIDGIKEVIRKSMCLPADRVISDQCDLAESLKVDSLDAIDIAMSLEERYGCVIPDIAIKDMRTPARALEVVQCYIGTSSI
jgi:acyl carrier protein